MWDSIGSNSCDSCEFSRNKNSCERSEEDFFVKTSISPTKNELSLFEEAAPIPIYCGTSSSPNCPSRRSVEDMDVSSHDSGYDTGVQAERDGFHSFGSGSICSMEEDFLEDFVEIETVEKSTTLPKDFSKLISDPLVLTSNSKDQSSPQDTIIRPLFRRALSLQNPTTATKNKVRTSLFGSDDEENKENRSSVKRVEPPTSIENTVIKRSKFLMGCSIPPEKPAAMRSLFNRQFSATEESIMCAVQRSSTQPDLIGDFSKSYCLPLTNGRHQDLKAITPDTLAKLMKGEFNYTVESFKVIDCRYPYEFMGGHISGALNIYTKEQISELLHESKVPSTNSSKRHILVFHCEFSSERGPNLYRYLRKEDRTKNMSDYPALQYPEIYLLEGGYKSFFQKFSEMCLPVAYKEMLHPDHEEDLRHFRQKSKTWNADSRQRPTKSLKRL